MCKIKLLKFLFIKLNPTVFLLIAKGYLVCNFKSSVEEILVSCYLLISISSLKELHAQSISALRNLVSFVQFKKREKHPWRNVTLSKAAGLLY